MTNPITAICVVYRTKALVQKAVESFRQFYTDVPLIVVDNSARDGECTRYLREITKRDEHTTIFIMDENVGHGPGMDYALHQIKTEWAYIFDSDTEMVKPGIIEEFELLSRDRSILAAGHIQLVSRKGRDSGKTKDIVNIQYVHPAICFINRKLYLECPPFRYHGAPCIGTYTKVHEQGMSDILLVNFPVESFVKHEWRGTRSFYKMKPWS